MSRIVGIDLGTTNSLVAYFDGGIPKVIPDSEGRALLPSIVASNLSPAINKGNNIDSLTTDQRGSDRVLPAVSGVIDIGAVEVA